MKNTFLGLMLIIASSTAIAGDHGGGGGGGGTADVMKLDSFVVNVSGGGYLTFTPQLKVVDPADQEYVKARMPVVRFEFIKALLGQDQKSVQTPTFISNFSEKMPQVINKALGNEYIKSVFVTDWMIR